MRGFKEYGTYFIVPHRTERSLGRLGAPRIWRVATRPDPSRRHWCDDSGSIVHVQFGERGSAQRAPGLHPARQLVVLANNEEVASKVASLVRAGALLGYPDLTQYPDVTDVFPVASTGRELLASKPFSDRFHHYEGGVFGCEVASAAWQERELVYAVEKLRFSLELDSFTPHSAAPSYRQVFSNKYNEETYHVNAAFAMVAAFSVIEELGLEIRSSQQNPRFIGAAGRDWNPRVLANVQARLKAANVGPTARTTWIRRGAATQVERTMKPKFGQPAAWNRQFQTRDRNLTIPEALHFASWIRNFVAAHKFRALASSISPYDVFNMQDLSRRLLLSRLGLWRGSN